MLLPTALLTLSLLTSAAEQAKTDKHEAPPPPPAHFTPVTSVLPVVLVLGALGAAALWLRRQKLGRARFVQVVETTPLGPRRALVVARMGDQMLLFGSSEAGINLLLTREATAELVAASEAQAAGIAELPTPPSFEDALLESAEDVELRRKLSRGIGGRVTS